MQAVVCPPPYPDRTKHAEVYVDGSDESGSRATNLTLFLHRARDNHEPNHGRLHKNGALDA